MTSVTQEASCASWLHTDRAGDVRAFASGSAGRESRHHQHHVSGCCFKISGYCSRLLFQDKAVFVSRAAAIFYHYLLEFADEIHSSNSQIGADVNKNFTAGSSSFNVRSIQ